VIYRRTCVSYISRVPRFNNRFVAPGRDVERHRVASAASPSVRVVGTGGLRAACIGPAVTANVRVSQRKSIGGQSCSRAAKTFLDKYGLIRCHGHRAGRSTVALTMTEGMVRSLCLSRPQEACKESKGSECVYFHLGGSSFWRLVWRRDQLFEAGTGLGSRCSLRTRISGKARKRRGFDDLRLLATR
jgi:hypothetical protein